MFFNRKKNHPTFFALFFNLLAVQSPWKMMELIFAIRNFEAFIPNQYGPTDFCPQLPGNKFSLASKIQSIYVCVTVAANINLFQFSYIEKAFQKC